MSGTIRRVETRARLRSLVIITLGHEVGDNSI
jgi:hypothetical protein